jgi:hypothetical protein
MKKLNEHDKKIETNKSQNKKETITIEGTE